MMIPVFRPSPSDSEIEAVKKVLKSGWWGAGPMAFEFENKFAAFIGTKHAVSLNSCTAALHLAVKVCDFPAGSEIITTPITFISTAFAASYNNCEVVFADIEEDTLNIDPEDIRRKITEKTRAIIPMHYGGHACRMDEIMEIAREFELTVIEDCAHATGGKYRDRMLGGIGDLGCFSFHAVKNLAMGDGGMITLNNTEREQRVIRLRWLGINRETRSRTTKDSYEWYYKIDEIGYKFQMNDILASIGLVQLERLEEMNTRRIAIVKRYNKAFSDLDWLETPVIKEYATNFPHNYVIKTDYRDDLMEYLGNHGISTSIHYMPLYMHPFYDGSNTDCPVAERVWKRLLTLPLYPDLKSEECDYIISTVKSFK